MLPKAPEGTDAVKKMNESLHAQHSAKLKTLEQGLDLLKNQAKREQAERERQIDDLKKEFRDFFDQVHKN